MPEPEGPTRPTDEPRSISSVIPLRMSTRPALPESDRSASLSERIISAIMSPFRKPRTRKGYGVIRAARNVGLALCLLGSPVLAEPVTLAAFGDSLTQGYGLPPEDGFVPQLESWLSQNGAHAKVVNAGVSGDTTAGGLSRVEWTLTPEIDGLIVALGGNDLLRGIDPAVSKSNLEGILSAAQSRNIPVLLVGMDAPSNYGSEYKQAFDSMYPQLARKFGVMLYPDFLSAISAQDDRQAALSRYMQPDGIHPNRDGVELIVESVGPSVLELVKLARE